MLIKAIIILSHGTTRYIKGNKNNLNSFLMGLIEGRRGQQGLAPFQQDHSPAELQGGAVHYR